MRQARLFWGFCLVLLLAALAVPMGGQSAQAAELRRFKPQADAHVNPDKPGRELGRRPQLVLGNDRVAYLRFHVRNLPGRVVKASLSLRTGVTSGRRLTVRGVLNTTWAERTINAANAPRPGMTVVRSGSLPENRRVALDVTKLITGNGIFSLALTSGSDKRIEIFSRESETPPRLRVLTSTTPYPVIAAAGDIACDPEMGAFRGGLGTPRACRMLATSNTLVWNRSFIDRVLLLGDVQYEDGSPEQFAASYDPTWGRVKDITLPSVGNHEYQTPGAGGYYAYFGASAGPPELGYYDVELGDWHLIALNSQCWTVGGCDEGSPQLEWLKARLAASTKPCTLAFWHIPRFSSGLHGSSASYVGFWEALYEDGAELILNGHDHVYERFAPMDADGNRDDGQGIRQFTVGTGGKNLHEWQSVLPNSQVRDNTVFGSLELELRPASYRWRFLPQAGQVVIDQGRGTCHGPPGS